MDDPLIRPRPVATPDAFNAVIRVVGRHTRRTSDAYPDFWPNDTNSTSDGFLYVADGTAPPPAATLTVRPGSLAFGTVAVGSAQTVTVTNTGTIGLPIKWIGLAGTDASEFGRLRKCPAVLEAGKQCVATVVLEPTSAGDNVARLVVSTGGTRKSTALSGTGR